MKINCDSRACYYAPPFPKKTCGAVEETQTTPQEKKYIKPC